MAESLAWALNQAREQTLALVADVPPHAMQVQAAPDERHPAWILGHLLLADSYLIHLLTNDRPQSTRHRSNLELSDGQTRSVGQIFC